MLTGRGDRADWSKSFMYTLHETYFLVEKRLEQRLSKDEDGITFSQFLVLIPLHCDQNSSQSDVADFLHLTEATVSRHIATLEKEGLLKKKEVPDNRRKHLLTLTARGEDAFKRAHGTVEKELREIFSVVDEKDRARMTQVMGTVLSRLTD